ncbi:MAG: hypothetical protein HY548_05660, partial [Elusimicrobia bacterium]|nr:hypothetical protein [Elusimicrobiota bacterium]
LYNSGRLTVSETTVELNKTTVTVRTDIRYNENGQMIGYTDTTNDSENGVVSQVTTATLTYNAMGQVATQSSLTFTQNDDGSWSRSESLLTNTYDEKTGLLIGVSSSGSFTSQGAQVWNENPDGSKTLVWPPVTTGTTRQYFGVVNGQARLLTQTTESTSTSPDGVVSESVTNTIYSYNELGRMVGALATGQTVSNDNGNISTSNNIQIFTVIQGETKLLVSFSDTLTVNLDGSDNHTWMTVTYTYDDRGQVTGASGYGHFEGHESGYTDPEHTWHDGWVDADGDGKLDYEGVDANGDGVVSKDEASDVDGDGTIESEITGPIDHLVDPAEVIWTDVDGDGEEDPATFGVTGTTTGDIVQVYEKIGREMRLVSTTSTSHSVNISGSVTDQTMTTTYTYDPAGRLTGAHSDGNFTTVTTVWTDPDGDGPQSGSQVTGSITTGTITQEYDVIQGAAKITESTSISDATNANGSTSHTETTVHYRYDASGRLTKAWGEGTFNSTDYGCTTDPVTGQQTLVVINRTQGTIIQDYVIINGQARLSSSRTETFALDIGTGRILVPGEDRYAHSISVVYYVYDSNGRLTGASGYTDAQSNTQVWSDPDGDFDLPSAEDGWVLQSDGKWKKVIENADGTRIEQIADQAGGSWDVSITVTDAEGRTTTDTVTTGRNESGHWENQTTVSHTVNTYALIAGQALVIGSTTQSTTVTGGGVSVTVSMSVVNYRYDANGMLVGASGFTNSTTTTEVLTDVGAKDVDGDGKIDILAERETQVTTAKTVNTYAVIAGQAVVLNSVTNSTTISNGGTSVTTSQSIVNYQYDEKGLLRGATGSSSSTTTGQVMQAKDQNGDGKIDEDDRVNGEFEYEQKDVVTTSSTTNTYALIMGQAQVIKSVTDSVSVSGGSTTTSHSVVDYKYDSRGKLVGASGKTTSKTETEVLSINNETGLQEKQVQITYSESINTYAIIWGQAVVTKSVTTSQTYTGYTEIVDGVPVDAKNVTYSSSVTNYSYNSNGQLTGATGSSDSTTVGKVMQTKDLNGDGKIDENDRKDLNGDGKIDENDKNSKGEYEYEYEEKDGITISHTDNVYNVIWGQAVVIQSVSTSETYSGYQGKDLSTWTSYTKSTSVTNYQYNNNGQLTGASGSSDTYSFTRNADGAVKPTTGLRKDDRPSSIPWPPGVGLDEKITLTVSHTDNTYAIILGQAVVIGSTTNSTTYSGYAGRDLSTAKNVTTTVSVTNYEYNALGQLIGASGSSESVTVGKVMQVKDLNGDGKLDEDDRKDLNGDGKLDENDKNSKGEYEYEYEEKDGITTSKTVNTYAVIWGQAVVTQSITTSKTYSGFEGKDLSSWTTYTESRSVTSYQYNAQGQLTGAKGSSDSVTYTRNADSGEPGEAKPPTNQIVGKGGFFDTIFGSIRKDAAIKIDLPPAKEGETFTITTSHTENTYAILWGQAVVTQSVTTSKTYSGYTERDIVTGEPTDPATVTTTTSVTSYQYNKMGQLVGATGFSNSVTVGKVMQAKDLNGDDKIDEKDKVGGQFQYEEKDGITTSETVNTYAVIWGQAVVTQSDTRSTTYSGFEGKDLSTWTTFTESHSVTRYQYNTFGQLTGASGFSDSVTYTRNADAAKNPIYADPSVSDLPATGRMPSLGIRLPAGDETVTITVSHTENTYAILWGQAVVTGSVTTSTTYSGYTAVDGKGVPLDAANV